MTISKRNCRIVSKIDHSKDQNQIVVEKEENSPPLNFDFEHLQRSDDPVYHARTPKSHESGSFSVSSSDNTNGGAK